MAERRRSEATNGRKDDPASLKLRRGKKDEKTKETPQRCENRPRVSLPGSRNRPAKYRTLQLPNRIILVIFASFRHSGQSLSTTHICDALQGILELQVRRFRGNVVGRCPRYRAARPGLQTKGETMPYLDQKVLDSMSADAFLKQQPYPFVNIQATMTKEGFDKLRTSMPDDMSQFKKMVGVKRGYGQGSHDRAILHNREGVKTSRPWQEFIAELNGPAYNAFVRRMLGLQQDKKLIFTMEWYYAWSGCSVSPHCDARRKLATHIFFFAQDEEWDKSWGGDVLMLDDEKKWKAHSAPGFDDLKVAATYDARKNASLFFMRTEHSWHAVRPLKAPNPDVFRKLFIVTINIPTFQVWWRRVRGKDPDGFRFRVE
jgi:hypothetical protein